MKKGLIVSLALTLVLGLLAPAARAQPPEQARPDEGLEKERLFFDRGGGIGRMVPGGVLLHDGSFLPRADGRVYLPGGSLAFERGGVLIFPESGITATFGEEEGLEEVRDEDGRRYKVASGFKLIEDSASGRHFVVPEGGRVVRDRHGRHHVLPPNARLEHDLHGRAFILPEGTHLERDSDGRSFVVPDGGRLERDAAGRTFVVPPGSRLVRDENGRGHVVPEGMRLEALRTETWPQRYAVLPPDAHIIEAGGRAYVVPRGRKLILEDVDRWPPRYRIVLEGEEVKAPK